MATKAPRQFVFVDPRNRRLGYSTRDMAKLLGVTQPAVRKAIEEQHIRAVPFGGMLIIPAEEAFRLFGRLVESPTCVA